MKKIANNADAFQTFLDARLPGLAHQSIGLSLNSWVSKLWLKWISIGHPLIKQVRRIKVQPGNPFAVIIRRCEYNNPLKMNPKLTVVFDFQEYRRTHVLCPLGENVLGGLD